MQESNNHSSNADHEGDLRLSASAFGQLDEPQRRLLEVDLQTDVDLRGRHEELIRVADALSRRHAEEPSPPPSLDLRRAIQARLAGDFHWPEKPTPAANGSAGSSRRRVMVSLAVTSCLLLLLLLLAVPVGQAWRARLAGDAPLVLQSEFVAAEGVVDFELLEEVESDGFGRGRREIVLTEPQSPLVAPVAPEEGREFVITAPIADDGAVLMLEIASEVDAVKVAAPIAVVPIVPEAVQKGVNLPVPKFSPPGRGISPAAATATATQPALTQMSVATVSGKPVHRLFASGHEFRFDSKGLATPYSTFQRDGLNWEARRSEGFGWYYEAAPPTTNREQYATIVENPFVPVSDQPLSTLSIDVDTASYANVRRFLTQNQLPPADAVRIEELVNYFSYDYAGPRDDRPLATQLEVAQCPWQPGHRLVRVALQGKTIERAQRPGCNLVFLLDVSGSMKDANKLPLLKQAMKLLVDQLDENDRVAIVTYASQAGVRLKSTVADNREVIRDAINGLHADGSTNGGAGIQLAYEQALAGAIEGGVNRVILATDGDLNVGITDDDALVRLIREQAAGNVFLTVLGFGEGNLQDAKLEKLADNGNGLYAYIDNLSEARKVLVEQVEGSLVTIAKDVKIKVEFNPAEVSAYRLIGYENRLLTAAEFDDDKKDAGEIGAGHRVTALYEIVPAAPGQVAVAEALKYQQPVALALPPGQLTDAAKSGELLTLSLRYKLPESDESTLVDAPLLNAGKPFSQASLDFRFAAAVASFGMLLRDSPHRGDTSFAAIEEIAAAALGDDARGYRTEFLDLVRRAAALK